MSVWDWDTDASNNTTVDGININNNCSPGNIDNGLRAIMANVRSAFASPLRNFFAGTNPLAVAYGGTGSTTKAGARAAIGAASAADVAAAIPTGLIFYHAATTAPTGFLACDGSAVSRTTYATLFGVIGTTFGSGDGSTTFNVPDLRGEFIRGWDNGRGVDTGRVFGSAQADDLKSHTHPASQTRTDIAGGGSQTVLTTGSSNATGSTGGTETRPRNIALLPCIKS